MPHGGLCQVFRPVLVVLVVLLSVPPLAAENFTFRHFAGTVGGPGTVDFSGTSARLHAPDGITQDAAGNLYVIDSVSGLLRVITPAGLVRTYAGGGVSTDIARYGTLRGSHVTRDGSGNIYVAVTGGHVIARIGLDRVPVSLAGGAGIATIDGAGTMAGFSYPTGIAFDGTTNTLIVSDRFGHAIRRVTLGGVVTTIAGTAGVPGTDDGTGTAARFNQPAGVAVDDSGNIYVADSYNHTIRKITPGGLVTTLAGLAEVPGETDGTSGARFRFPNGVAVDSSGNVYVADLANNMIRRVTPGGLVETLAGTITAGHADGSGIAARFSAPSDILVDKSGDCYVTDRNNHAVRKVTQLGAVTTIAGRAPERGLVNATGANARFDRPAGLVTDSLANLYVADSSNARIRRISSTGVVTTFAGDGGHFSRPEGLGIDSDGNLYVADINRHAIYKVTPGGVVSIFAGSPGNPGVDDGSGTEARFAQPTDLTVDASGNVYVADLENHSIRKITPAGVVTTFAGLTGTSGAVNGVGSAARFRFPFGIAIDSSGNLYVADYGNSAVRRITPAAEVTTFAGVMGEFGLDDGNGESARFGLPMTIAVDGFNNVYVGETTYNILRRITPSRDVTTVAGQLLRAANEDATGLFAAFSDISGIAFDSAGRIYVSNDTDHVILRGETALAAAAVIDQASGEVGSVRQLGTSPNPGTTWTWEVIRRPFGSVATFSSANVHSPTFVPDRPGIYVFRLSSSAIGGISSITKVMLTATCSSTTRVAPAHPAAATVGEAYSQTFTVVGGGGGLLTFAVHTGTLPPGLALSSGGTLSGTPTTPGTYTFMLSATNETACAAYREYSFVVGTLPPPANLVATGSPSGVSLTWSAVPEAATYLVYRRPPGGSWAALAHTHLTSFNDLDVAVNHVYAYSLRSVDPSENQSGPGPVDVASTSTFDPVSAGSPIIATDWHQMRTLIRDIGLIADLGEASFTDFPLTGVPIRAVHLSELRNRLSQSRAILGLPAVSFTDAVLVGATVKAVHMQELRSGVQ